MRRNASRRRVGGCGRPSGIFPQRAATYSFFKDVEGRNTAWIRPDHWSAQVLTSHDDFRAHLASPTAGPATAVVDTVAHFLIDCEKFEPQRVALREYVGADSWR